MHARVSTYTGEPEALIEGFQAATQPLQGMDGFAKGYFLVDRSTNKAVSITLWESEDALLASARQADELRKNAAESAGGTIDSVEQYEIVLTAERAGAGVS